MMMMLLMMMRGAGVDGDVGGGDDADDYEQEPHAIRPPEAPLVTQGQHRERPHAYASESNTHFGLRFDSSRYELPLQLQRSKTLGAHAIMLLEPRGPTAPDASRQTEVQRAWCHLHPQFWTTVVARKLSS